MSIINDALKKAQRQRAQETTAHPASVGAHRGGGQHRAMGPGLILIVGLLGAIVVLLGTIAFWPSSPSAPAKVVAKPTTAPAPAPVVKPVVTAEPVLAKAAPEPTPVLQTAVAGTRPQPTFNTPSSAGRTRARAF